MNDLSPKMQARLNRWKSRDTSTKKENTQKQKSPGNYVGRRKDYGDDLSEFKDLKSIENNIKR